ncbi:jg1976, partial [Pararge aegeria aegeria]
MSDYAKIKKLDEKSLQKLKEGTGPADEWLCPILSPPEVKKGFAASVKKVFRSRSRGKRVTGGQLVGLKVL